MRVVQQRGRYGLDTLTYLYVWGRTSHNYLWPTHPGRYELSVAVVFRFVVGCCVFSFDV